MKKEKRNKDQHKVGEPNMLRYQDVDPDYVPADYDDQVLHTDCHHGQS